MIKRYHGFTIVELLVVIVVVAILASISVVAYNGVQTRAKNAARIVEASAWTKSFKLYRAVHGTFPQLPYGGYCLGTGFPNGGRCRDANDTDPAYMYTEADSAALMAEIKTVSSLPSGGPRDLIDGTVGPYIEYRGAPDEEILIIMVLDSSSGITCPSSSEKEWASDDRRLLCRIVLVE